MYEELSELIAEAKAKGLPAVVWSYPRGEDLSKEGETGVDVCAYAAQIAAQLGAHVIKIKPPSAHIEQDAARKVYEANAIPIGTLEERVRHVVQSAFNGRRIVIFSGGAAKGDEEVLKEISGIAAGGGFGSIMGRNAPSSVPKIRPSPCCTRLWTYTRPPTEPRAPVTKPYEFPLFYTDAGPGAYQPEQA